MEVMKYKQIQHVQIIVIILNLAASLSKLFIGAVTKSASITADGFHSLGDGLNNIVGIVGVYFAFQPIDKKHPYGHRKFETMTTLFIAGLLIITSIKVLTDAYNRIVNPLTLEVNMLSFIVMIFTILINIFVTTYEKKKGKELKSDFLISDATHTLSDVFISISVMVTLIAVKLGFPWVDTAVSILISLLIIKAAFDILRSGTDVLCDAAVLEPGNISKIVCELPEVYSCHKIRSRGVLDDIHLDFHIVVKSNMTLERAHSLVHEIEDLLKIRIPGVTDVNVHVDPYEYIRTNSQFTNHDSQLY
ncbi:cation diffusion facilitator family transporter [Tissierella sp. Yu-01]|uniref:cation diffusion facilitator family transporter n=1 Tax=Tissierella sp. Yu-01 TaxID=3035694 RepID=UPI00240D0627|nr:cation diffusion facilitator family transporter [Tissierella sp. Yu-01]WFA09969.1 cation diffusion facilitator family transporter [Tissierella sp. Yu-01]